MVKQPESSRIFSIPYQTNTLCHTKKRKSITESLKNQVIGIQRYPRNSENYFIKELVD